MNKDWILQTKEIKKVFSKSTWVPLRESINNEKGNVKNIVYLNEYFGCGSVAFPPEQYEVADELSWSDIGIGHTIQPYAYEDGYYASIEQYQRNDKEPIGINLVFEYYQPVVGRRKWILNPDLIIALRLVKEDNNWVRPEENFIVVAREFFDDEGNHIKIEIKREFLLDYLAARNLTLKLSYYRQRVENVSSLENSEYVDLEDHKEEKYGGQYELLIRSLESIYGGSYSVFRSWRTDIDEDDDAPVMEPENNENTDYETAEGYTEGDLEGFRVEGEFWRDEWIVHKGISNRVRGDKEVNLPQFIVETDGTRINSIDLKYEEVGRWLWFNSSIINQVFDLRGFNFKWFTSETGGIYSTSGYTIHFGINSSDLITVYAYDIARLPAWEQNIWASHNVVPDGKVSAELLASQIKVQPAKTHAVEDSLFEIMSLLEIEFKRVYKISLFIHDVDREGSIKKISRFESKDQDSLLRLAKELIRVFSDRLNVSELRKISTHINKNKLGSNKLLQDILSQKIGSEEARKIFSPIVGAYDMRIGDAHPTGSRINDAIKLAGIDCNISYLRQGKQLITNFAQSIFLIGKLLFKDLQKDN